MPWHHSEWLQWVAGSIDALMVVYDNFEHQLSRAGSIGEDNLAFKHVAAHHVCFIDIESPWFRQNAVGNAHFSDILQQRT